MRLLPENSYAFENDIKSVYVCQTYHYLVDVFEVCTHQEINDLSDIFSRYKNKTQILNQRPVGLYKLNERNFIMFSALI